MQTSVGNANSRTVLNIGVGRRYLSDDESMIAGLNAFVDYDQYGHQRASIGTELKASAFELTANSYKALTNWKSGKSSNQERALDGYEVEVGAQIPYMPAAKLYVKNWKWQGVDGVADTKGNNYSCLFRVLKVSKLSWVVGTMVALQQMKTLPVATQSQWVVHLQNRTNLYFQVDV